MTIESKLDALTAAITLLTQQLGNRATPVEFTQPAQVITPPVAVAPPVVAIPEAQPQTTVQMPTLPVFSAPQVEQPVTPAAPFSDAKGLTDYVIGVYTSLGADKGAAIQSVITSLGYDNINDIKPEHYGALFSGVEALKG